MAEKIQALPAGFMLQVTEEGQFWTWHVSLHDGVHRRSEVQPDKTHPGQPPVNPSILKTIL
jgi:hypothetical protein